ncbi:NAD(P)-binding protein [Fragilariopsis cylindrus CCMP1102]|uniref:NAD(P)-binding protein n=1 Tax=Fragilariopsis cylindrus CCMP1102 TaxID=635003 RepID=A0A1E7FUL2_9STRA|nr:NAD(P)-binding protein [Fragilariopsis cylindrus CCMP1102]|eukprot:OEU21848.1 NAD(P)-binding protein [Fragilariopsis cylindrus CCMP1102]
MNDQLQLRPIAAVTGASGFIGSYLCRNLLEHGYLVRACVRANIPSKVDHLRALATSETTRTAGGILEVCVADMSIQGAYDDIFGNGCGYVFHVAGNFGTDYHLWKSKSKYKNNNKNNHHNKNHENNQKGRLPPIDKLLKEIHKEAIATSKNNDKNDNDDENYYSYDHAVYESYVVAMEWLLQSVAKHKDTIRRIVYTSSGAAGGTITGPPVADDEKIVENSYGRAKRDCEAMLYEFCKNISNDNSEHEKSNHIKHTADSSRRIGLPNWEVTDVRDVAETHRLAAEAIDLVNGTRFWNGTDPGWKVSDMLDYIAHHEDFEDEKRFAPILLQDDSSSDSDSGSSCGEESDDKDDDSSSSSSCCSEDSYGVSEWDTAEQNTTTWSDPILVFQTKGYKPRTPHQTVLETAASISIRHRWTVLGRDLTLKECSDYYTVAEMDGCDEEMEWLANQIQGNSQVQLWKILDTVLFPMIFGGLPNGRCGYYKCDANPPPNEIFASSQQLHDWVQFISTASTGGKNKLIPQRDLLAFKRKADPLVGYGNKAKKQRKIGKGLHVPNQCNHMEVRLYDGKDFMFTIFEDDRIDPNPSRTSTIITFF